VDWARILNEDDDNFVDDGPPDDPNAENPIEIDPIEQAAMEDQGNLG
jgi:hypothetical protein